VVKVVIKHALAVTVMIIASAQVVLACSGGADITKTVTSTQTETQTTTVTTTLSATTATTTETFTLPATTITQTLTVTPLPPRLIWVEKSGLVVRFNYSAGILMGCTVYQYFEVSDGSGEVEISAIIGDTSGVPFMDNSEITDTYTVEEGELYRLSIEVNIVASQPSDPLELKDSFDIIISSPAAASSEEVTIGEGYFHRVNLEQMNLEPWQ